MNITIGSLFSGIGGLELGLERATGARTVWQVERDPFCRRVLARHWPDAQRFQEVHYFGGQVAPPVDIICGGFPCQDLSVAGDGAGLTGERSGLFWQFTRIVRELRPRVVVMENVAALLARGLGQVLGQLAALGYDAEWDCVPASAVGAPHQRDRVFIVAHAIGNVVREQPNGEPERYRAREPREPRAPWRIADAALTRLEGGWERLFAPRVASWGQPPPSIRGVDEGAPARLDGPRRRRPVNDKDRLRALGNAVVPKVAEVIGRRVAEILG